MLALTCRRICTLAMVTDGASGVHCRAVAAAEAVGSPTAADGVAPGTYVRVHVTGVPPSVAESLLARHAAVLRVSFRPCCVASPGVRRRASRMCPTGLFHIISAAPDCREVQQF
jgi:hypothetical protein